MKSENKEKDWSRTGNKDKKGLKFLTISDVSYYDVW